MTPAVIRSTRSSLKLAWYMTRSQVLSFTPRIGSDLTSLPMALRTSAVPASRALAPTRPTLLTAMPAAARGRLEAFWETSKPVLCALETRLTSSPS